MQISFFFYSSRPFVIRNWKFCFFGTANDSINRCNQIFFPFIQHYLKKDLTVCINTYHSINPFLWSFFFIFQSLPSSSSISIKAKDMDVCSTHSLILQLDFCNVRKKIKKFNIDLRKHIKIVFIQFFCWRYIWISWLFFRFWGDLVFIYAILANRVLTKESINIK